MKSFQRYLVFSFLILASCASASSQGREYLFSLKSQAGHGGDSQWLMKKSGEVTNKSEDVSRVGYSAKGWAEAIVPGTVLNSLVAQGVYPEPYFGLNNKITSNKIPDLSTAGHDFYTYWFRTEFDGPQRENHERLWMQVDGVNYRAEFWLNGKMVCNIAGMFRQEFIDVTDYINSGNKNVLAVKVYPIDEPGGPRQGVSKSWGAAGEFRNGGNGEIGKNTTMLMTVGWDFTYLDGIRDRNTGIWKDISFFKTGEVQLNHPFVKSDLRKPDYNHSQQTVSVELHNPGFRTQKVKIKGEIVGEGICFEKDVEVLRGLTEVVEFNATDFPQLAIDNPRLWWPINKGPQELYTLSLKAEVRGVVSDSIVTRFGIREITSHTNTPDKSRTFKVNGKDIFIKGTNWLPENMLRTTNERTYAELRYSAQSGVNLIRFWGGGITESDYFFDLCDELGIMIWKEFWMTGDTKHPIDKGLHLQNAESTVKRVRNHPSLAYYVCSNESTEMTGLEELLNKIDGTRGYQMQSECCGIHDGSPYKTVNPMRHYENTASERGSRVDGFNPEYGAPCLPTVECLREMMPEKDLWPINTEVWDYSDGNGFHQMSSLYVDLVNEYGKSESIDEFAMKGQFVGAMSYKSIWEVWNYNKLNYGDRYTSGFLFWYHNSPIRQVCGRMWDWSLEPTAALYAAANACEPLHPQYDYLKNTVSVINDYYKAFSGYKVTAEVYDINSKQVWKNQAIVNLPEDGAVNDVIKIDFPKDISPVHFIKLRLFDDKGKEVGSNFYWRSNSVYGGMKSMTGPATAGFESIKNLAPTKVAMKYKTRTIEDRHYIDIELKNTGRSIAFFTQLQWLDATGKPVRPSYYTDNFFSMMPGESRKITIETDKKNLPADNYSLILKGFNVNKVKSRILVN
ncbi:sugar-binding domain-containing protein [Bacteroides sp. 519]|uniref:glycoside hydrolase family 2 protein n=1 Tax=Bacteroides sp. 519 TaxID=2302937 RepID=UPI0013D04BF8|nr:sugar-binding domain-containing protein [Bacteroides sp. 519]NDV60306.1 glycoside hydrolase family 2 [Bacteroides sp. 519]